MQTRIRLNALGCVLGIFTLTGFSQADEATYWNRVALDAIKLAKTPPPVAARNLAISSVAQSDAINAIGGVNNPYAYAGTGSVMGASKEAAVAAAAYNTLKDLFPGQRTMIDAAWNDRMTSLGSGDGITNGIRLGTESAQAMMGLRSADGASSANYSYLGSADAGKWRPTDNGLAGALPGWGKVTPFSMISGDVFRPSINTDMTTQQYTDAYNEVRMYGAKDSTVRTLDQTQVAGFWAAGGGTVTPPGMWNEIASKVATDKNSSLDQNVRMFGTLNVALADSGIAAWDVKYSYEMWRPETAIRNGSIDGNGATIEDATWKSYMVTPNHPSCVSGHSTFSSAGATVLSAFFGNNTQFSIGSDSLAGTERSFSSFSEAAAEAGQSRIYGGIHFQFDNQYGLALGSQVGDAALKKMNPVPEPASLIALGAGALGLLRRRKNKSH
jgi:PAP2 superfamily/PEP-CTERM motif